MIRFQERIISDPITGIARIRSLPLSVDHVRTLLLKGLSEEEILVECPGLILEDIKACKNFVPGKQTETSLNLIIASLKSDAIWLNVVGFILFIVAIFIGNYVYDDIKNNTITQIDRYLTVTNGTSVDTVYPKLIYLIVRSSAIGVIAVTVIVFCVKTAVACFDQSARFIKRRNGALFLKHLFDSFSNDRLEEKVKIEDIRKFFESWNQNIESAFSSVKVDKKAAGAVEVNVNKDGAKAKVDDRDV